MFGSYKFPLKLEEGKVSISVEKEKDVFVYKRKCDGDTTEMVLLADKGKLIINPIEPLNIPKEITPYLLIEFDRPVIAAPKAAKIVFIKFPIEIGIFIQKAEKNELLDLFSLAKPKFTLYGNPRTGVICKHYRSDVYTSQPDFDLLSEGLLEILVKNNADKWVEVTKSVLSAYGMKVYFNGEKSAMKAVMKIDDKMNAETDFVDSPLEKEMKKALELFSQRKIHLSSTKFVMRDGL